ncbi:MAG TPA: hypothetical protein PKD53_24520 [Chloroflexaceae bacterium]|nr:hypothetical protein [Chloroflexaceae bacterium]
MSRPVRPSHRTRFSTLVFVAAPLLLVAIAIGAVVSRPQAKAAMPPPEQAAVPHFIDVKAPGEPRTVVVGGMSDSLPGTSNEAGYLMTNLRAGTIPEGATTATVLTDTNCEPDADGVSHCLNDLQIGNVVVTVQHHHQMHSVPCLSPDEIVTLMPFAQYEAEL